MEIKVLGSGCAKCKRLFSVVEKAVSESKVSANIIKVENIDEITSFGVMMTPALVVDNEVKCAGRIPPAKEIIGWIKK